MNLLGFFNDETLNAIPFLPTRICDTSVLLINSSISFLEGISHSAPNINSGTELYFIVLFFKRLYNNST